MNNKTKQCPFCGEQIDINTTKCEFCGETLPKEENVKQIEDTQYKECPFCAEKININAKKCKHCGEMIEKQHKKSISNLKYKECPFCYNAIPIRARKCTYCGEWVIDDEKETQRTMLSNPITSFLSFLSLFITILIAVIMNVPDIYEKIFYSIFIYIGLFLVGLIYFLPSVIASKRCHPQVPAIFIINLFFGGTVIAWIICIIWATTHRQGRNTHW